MAHYKALGGLRGRPKRIWWVLLALLALAIIGVIVVRQLYNTNLSPVSNDQTTQIYTVAPGMNFKQVAQDLEEKKLIRSAWAMELYVHSKQLTGKLQAGTYALSPSQGTGSVVSVLTKGKVATRLVTILPGRRIDQVRADLINDGFTPESVDAALEPEQYADIAVLSYKPAEITTLEGLLWPDSYQRDANTDPAIIIRQSLQQMSERLTPQLQADFAAQGLTVYQGLILASIIEKEVSTDSDRAQAAQVFYKRIKTGVGLESDVTALYGAVLAGRTPSVSYESPYNTYTNKGLPPSPISTASQTALDAAAKPAATDWLYFVAGDNGMTYFSKTLEEHEALTAQHCKEKCSLNP